MACRSASASSPTPRRSPWQASWSTGLPRCACTTTFLACMQTTAHHMKGFLSHIHVATGARAAALRAVRTGRQCAASNAEQCRRPAHHHHAGHIRRRQPQRRPHLCLGQWCAVLLAITGGQLSVHMHACTSLPQGVPAASALVSMRGVTCMCARRLRHGQARSQ